MRYSLLTFNTDWYNKKWGFFPFIVTFKNKFLHVHHTLSCTAKTLVRSVVPNSPPKKQFNKSACAQMRQPHQRSFGYWRAVWSFHQHNPIWIWICLLLLWALLPEGLSFFSSPSPLKALLLKGSTQTPEEKHANRGSVRNSSGSEFTEGCLLFMHTAVICPNQQYITGHQCSFHLTVRRRGQCVNWLSAYLIGFGSVFFRAQADLILRTKHSNKHILEGVLVAHRGVFSSDLRKYATWGPNAVERHA